MSIKNIKVHIGKELSAEIDNYKLLQAIVFFISDIFQNYNEKYQIIVCIEDDKEMKSQGKFLVLKNDLHLLISPSEIKKAIKVKLSYKTFKKSLFFTILHEIGHALSLLKNYKEDDEFLEGFFDIVNNDINNFKEKIKESGVINEIEMSVKIPEETLADRFAFSNLSYFENLYDFEGIIIPT